MILLKKCISNQQFNLVLRRKKIESKSYTYGWVGVRVTESGKLSFLLPISDESIQWSASNTTVVKAAGELFPSRAVFQFSLQNQGPSRKGRHLNFAKYLAAVTEC